MFHSEYESRLRSPSKSPSKMKYNNTPISSPLSKLSFINDTHQDNSSNSNSNSNNSSSSNNIMNNENQNDSNIMNITPKKTTTTTTTTTTNISPIIGTTNNYYYSQDNYGDRFIPISSFDSMYQYNSKEIQDHFNNNNNSNNNNNLSIANNNSSNSNNNNNNYTTTTTDRQRDESHLAYNLVLKNEILKSPNSSPSKLKSTSISSPLALASSIPFIKQNQEQQQLYESSPSKKNNVLQFKMKKGNSDCIDSPYSLSLLSGETQKLLSSPRKPTRKISKTPFKILEAPRIKDDFYLNLVDWSSSNLLAVGLDTTVYLWNATTSQVSKLCDMDSNQPITSVSWVQRGTHLAVGGNDGIIQIWDVTKKQKIRELHGHNQRVNAMAWNNHILSSGGKDKVILNHDVRSSEAYSSKLIGHKHEVCGLKWSPDGQQLASGGNDNLLNVWDQSSTRPLYQFKFHNAAVKAIAWSPHQRGLLASGGGTHDKCIRFWNTNTGHSIQSIDTGSQVCNLAWSKNVNEFVSTHGYSQNQITIWNYATMSPITTLTGHTTRVLYLSISPDGQTIVTGAGDNTLRFWNVFPSNKETTFSYNMDSFFNKHDLDIR